MSDMLDTEYFNFTPFLLEELERSTLLTESRASIIRSKDRIEMLTEAASQSTPDEFVYGGPTPPVRISWPHFKNVYTDYKTYPTTEKVLQGLGIPSGHFADKESGTPGKALSRIRDHFMKMNQEAQAMQLPSIQQRRKFYVESLEDEGVPSAHKDQIDPGRRGRKNRGTRVLDMLNNQPVIPGEFYNDYSRIPKARWTEFVRQWERIKTRLAKMARIFMGPTWGMTFIMGFQYERNLVIEIWYNSATSMFNVYDQNGAALSTPSLTLQESIQYFVTHLLQTSDVDEDVFSGNSNQLHRSYMNSLKQAGLAAADVQRRDYLEAREKARDQSAKKLNANASAENAAYRERHEERMEKEEKEKAAAAEKSKNGLRATIGNSIGDAARRASLKLDDLTHSAGKALDNAEKTAKGVGEEAVDSMRKVAADSQARQVTRRDQSERQAKTDAEIARQDMEERIRKQQERNDAAREADNRRRAEQRKISKGLRDTAAEIQKRTGKFTTANMVAQAKARTQLGEAETDLKKIMRALNKIREEKKALSSVKNTDAGKRAIANKDAAIRETEKELSDAQDEVKRLKAQVKKQASEQDDKPEGLNESIQVLREFQPRGTRGDKFFSAKAFQFNQGWKSREMLLYMHPQTFLKMADPIQEKERAGSKHKTDGVKSVLTSGEKFDSLPYLRVDRSRGGIAKVVSHDGRHRAMALNEIGVDSIPVRFESENIRWEVQIPGTFDWVDEWPTYMEAQQGSYKIPFPVEREESIQENTDLASMFGDDGSLEALQTIDREVVSIRKMAQNQNTTGQIGELMETMLTTYDTTRVRSGPKNFFRDLFRGRRLPIETPLVGGVWHRIKQMFGATNYRADFIVGFSLRETINIEVWYVTEKVRGLPTSSFYVYDVTADRIVRGNLPYYRSAIQVVLAKIGVS